MISKEKSAIFEVPKYSHEINELKANIRVELEIEEIEKGFQKSAVTERIIFNCLLGIQDCIKSLPTYIYISEADSSLQILFVFEKKDAEKMDDVYTLLPSYQDYSILNEERDFNWHLMVDDVPQHELIRHDYDIAYVRKKSNLAN